MSESDQEKPNLIIANLDGESELSLLGTGKKPSSIKQSVLNHISLLGSLMRIYAHPNGHDVLWTPVPIDNATMTPIPSVPSVNFISNSLSNIDSSEYGEIIPWIDTPSTDKLRTKSLSEMSLTANSKETCLNWSKDLQVRLPGQAVLQNIEELEKHINTIQGSGSWTGSWVLKARWSAAGRWRYISKNDFIDQGKERQSIENLFSHYGALIFEPWQERLSDWGALIEVGEKENIKYLGLHQQSVDGGGRIQNLKFYRTNIETLDLSPGESLTPTQLKLIMEVSIQIGEKLSDLGYRGPVSIDTWKYETPQGSALNPLGEINARFSLGRVVRDWINHLEAQRVLPEYKSITFESGSFKRSHNEKQIVLIQPTEPQGFGAWLKIED